MDISCPVKGLMLFGNGAKSNPSIVGVGEDAVVGKTVGVSAVGIVSILAGVGVSGGFKVGGGGGVETAVFFGAAVGMAVFKGSGVETAVVSLDLPACVHPITKRTNIITNCFRNRIFAFCCFNMGMSLH